MSVLLLQDLKEARTIGIPLTPVEGQILEALLKGNEPPMAIYDHFSFLLQDQGFIVQEIALIPSDLLFRLRIRKGIKFREFLIGPCEAVLLSMKNAVDLVAGKESFESLEQKVPLGDLSGLFSFSQELTLTESAEKTSHYY